MTRFQVHLPSRHLHGSKFAIETLEQGVKYVQKLTMKTPVLVSLLLTLNIFHTLF